MLFLHSLNFSLNLFPFFFLLISRWKQRSQKSFNICWRRKTDVYKRRSFEWLLRFYYYRRLLQILGYISGMFILKLLKGFWTRRHLNLLWFLMGRRVKSACFLEYRITRGVYYVGLITWGSFNYPAIQKFNSMSQTSKPPPPPHKTVTSFVDGSLESSINYSLKEDFQLKLRHFELF